MWADQGASLTSISGERQNGNHMYPCASLKSDVGYHVSEAVVIDFPPLLQGFPWPTSVFHLP